MSGVAIRLFPKHADNHFQGYRAALWLLAIGIALKTVVGLNSIFNTASVARGADGIALETFGAAAASEVLTLFAVGALGQLVLAVIGLIILLRYRALVPLFYLIMLGEQVARRLIVESHSLVRTESAAIGWYVIMGFMVLTALGLLLSLIPAGRSRPG